MNLRKLRWAIIAYALFDLYIGGYNGGFLPLSVATAAAQTVGLLAQGQLGVSCNAVATATSTLPGAAGGCTSLNLLTSGGSLPGVYTWQVITTGSPASVTVTLQGSLDGVTWTQLDTTSAAGSRTTSSAAAYRFLGCIPSTLSGGTSPTVTCQISITSTPASSGSGTVSANSGTAGAIASYAATGGSTTVGPTVGVNSTANNELEIGSSTNQGTLKLFGTTSSGTIQSSGNSTEIDFSAVTAKFGGSNATLESGAGSLTLSGVSTLVLSPGTSTGVSIGPFGFTGGKGQHFTTQAANNDMSGVCSGTTTTCSVTFTTSYTSTPSCVATPTTAGVTSFIITSQANTGFTITYAPSASTTFNYVCIGDAN